MRRSRWWNPRRVSSIRRCELCFTGVVRSKIGRLTGVALDSIFLYLVLLGLFGGTAYFVYSTWIATLFPQKRGRGKGGERAKRSSGGSKKVDPSEQVAVLGEDGPAVTSSARAYDESWIPEGHLKRPEARRVKSSGTPSRSKK